MHAGLRVEVGQTIKATPLEASDLLASGRGELAHAADLEAVRQAERAELQRQLRAAGRARLGDVPPSPWQPLDSGPLL